MCGLDDMGLRIVARPGRWSTDGAARCLGYFARATARYGPVPRPPGAVTESQFSVPTERPRALDWLRVCTGIAAVLGILLAATGVQVTEGEAVVVTRSGILRLLDSAGLHCSPAHRCGRRVDLRRTFDRPCRDAHARPKTSSWWVRCSAGLDPLRFHRSIGTVDDAEEKLDGLISNAQIGVPGRFDLSALTSTDPTTLRTAEIEQQLLEATQQVVSDAMESRFSPWPAVESTKDNVSAVFKQMRAERRQYAARYEAEGAEEVARIRSRPISRPQRSVRKAQKNRRASEVSPKRKRRVFMQKHRQDPAVPVRSFARGAGLGGGFRHDRDSAHRQSALPIAHERGELSVDPTSGNSAARAWRSSVGGHRRDLGHERSTGGFWLCSRSMSGLASRW